MSEGLDLRRSDAAFGVNVVLGVVSVHSSRYRTRSVDVALDAVCVALE